MASKLNDDFDLPNFKLPVLSSDESQVFQCPDEQTPISEAVHLARLASGWSSCSKCTWNNNAGSHNANDSAASDSSIRRTSCGVRGAYLNAIDRFRAAQLGAILASHLSRVAAVRAAIRAGSETVQVKPAANICVGYDDRSGSQDLFAGVVSAVRQNGCNVIDAGRSTTASLLSLCRSSHQPDGCIMVTGNGAATGQVGLDVFDGDGRTVSIPWTDFSVGVRLADNPQTDSVPTGPRWQTTAAFNRLSPTPDPAPRSIPSDKGGILQLPDMSESQQFFRSGRSSGGLSSVEVEDGYRNWLSKWWPSSFDKNVCLKANSELTELRLQWLAKDCPSIEVQAHKEGGSENSRRLTMEVCDDDRYLKTFSQSGRQIESAELATWINQASRTTATHVTAHPSDDGRQVLLVDLASPGSGRTHVIICDANAVVGIVLTLAANSRNLLPA